ncbi:hypothetical protein ABID93_004767, partial [Pseudomonas trivialis]
GGGLLPMASAQQTLMLKTHRFRGQVESSHRRFHKGSALN